MKLILALALGATAQFATPALRGGARRLEALELLGAEESAKVEAEQEAARGASRRSSSSAPRRVLRSRPSRRRSAPKL